VDRNTCGWSLNSFVTTIEWAQMKHLPISRVGKLEWKVSGGKKQTSAELGMIKILTCFARKLVCQQATEFSREGFQ